MSMLDTKQPANTLNTETYFFGVNICCDRFRWMLNLLTCCGWPDVACIRGDQVLVPEIDGGDGSIALNMSCQGAGSTMFDSKAGTNCRSSHLLIVTHQP